MKISQAGPGGTFQGWRRLRAIRNRRGAALPAAVHDDFFGHERVGREGRDLGVRWQNAMATPLFGLTKEACQTKCHHSSETY